MKRVINIIHKYSLHNKNIVIDVNSGSIHEVDDIVYDVLDCYENNSNEEIFEELKDKYAREDIKDALDDILELENEGMLFSEDANIDEVLNDRKPVIKAMCLHISHDCNLRCKYCFASTGDFKGDREYLALTTGKKALDFLVASSGNRRNLEVDFFGGEPLMNFHVVKELVDYGRAIENKVNKKFRFTITTNAMLLDEEKMDYINRNMDNLVLSIDGRPEVNDNMRYTISGKGSYDVIMPKIKDAVNSRNGEKYYVRGTFTGENLDFSNDILHLADEGFKQISVEPVVAAKDSGYEINEEHLSVIFEEYEKLALEMSKRKDTEDDFNFFHFMIDLEGGPCIIKRSIGCGAGTEYVAVTPKGEIYPCHQFVGQKEFIMGNVNKSFCYDKQEESSVYTKEECKNCWAKFYCSGGCMANAWQFNQDFHIPYKVGCEMEKKRLECAIWLKTL